MRRIFLFILPLLLIMGSCGPRLTPEQRRQDIAYLAQWARNYSPFVTLNEKFKDLPSYEALAPHYMQLAEAAESNAEFFQVMSGYFNLIAASGHGFLLPEESLKGYLLESLWRGGQLPWYQLHAASYWPKLQKRACYVHPPFSIIHRNRAYFVDEDWHHQDQLIPKGSRITRVNGITCSSYIDHLQKNTWLRYVAGNTDWIKKRLLVVHEGKGFRGWKVDFVLPDGTLQPMFVPWKKGFPENKSEFSDYWAGGGNCICLELTEQVGYIRVKCMGGVFIKKDGTKIRKFLEDSAGKYRKLIIDVRNNGGGLHYYFFDNLIAPFLDESVTFAQVAGIRKPFLTDHEPDFLELLRRGVSIFAHETTIEQIKPPEDFAETRWVFYRIGRKVEPGPRYNFSGDLYILVNEGTGSAADEYVNTAHRIGLATLVGQSSNGSCGPYFNPVMVRLPASGMIFMLEADLLLNQDGSVNEITGTKPDIELAPFPLPETVTKDALLHDEWVRKIIQGSD